MKTLRVKELMLLSLFTAMAWSASAQLKVGDNPNRINPNAVLEMESSKKGVLLPRVQLVQTTNPSPLTAHIAGMYVYNSAEVNDVKPGTYYNDGTKWVRGEGVQGPKGDAGVANGANGITYTASTQTVSLPAGTEGQVLVWNKATNKWEPKDDIDRTGAIIVGQRESLGEVKIYKPFPENVGFYTGMSITLTPGKYLVFARAGYLIKSGTTFSWYISLDTEKSSIGSAISNFVGRGTYASAATTLWRVEQTSFVVNVTTTSTYYVKQVDQNNPDAVAPNYDDEYNLYAIRID